MNRSRNRTGFGFSLGSLGSSFGIGLHSFGLGSSGYTLGGGYRSSNPYSSSYRGYLSGRGQNSYDDHQNIGRTYSRYDTSSPEGPGSGASYNRYYGANVEEELTSARSTYEPLADNTKQQYGGLRSKSSDVISSVLNRFRDQRSTSRAVEISDRDQQARKERRQSYVDSSSILYNRDSSVPREAYREQSFTPARKLGSVGPGAVEKTDQQICNPAPLPPPRFRRSTNSHYSSLSNIVQRNEEVASKQSYPSPSLFSRFPVTRSQSLHDLSNPDIQRPPRRQTLTSGVSQLDLQKARQTYSDAQSVGVSGSYSALNISSRSLHTERQVSTPSRAASLTRSFRDLGYASQPSSRRESINDVSTAGLATSDDPPDYKKLWEESVAENTLLVEEMRNIKEDLLSTRNKLQLALKESNEQRELEREGVQKKTLETRLMEMETELKELQKLKTENERLKMENFTLNKMVSNLTETSV